MKKTKQTAFTKLYNDMQDGETFIKKNHITLCDYHTATELLKEYYYNGSTKTFNKTVADIFASYQFTVTPDYHGINYIIK